MGEECINLIFSVFVQWGKHIYMTKEPLDDKEMRNEEEKGQRRWEKNALTSYSLFLFSRGRKGCGSFGYSF